LILLVISVAVIIQFASIVIDSTMRGNPARRDSIIGNVDVKDNECLMNSRLTAVSGYDE